MAAPASIADYFGLCDQQHKQNVLQHISTTPRRILRRKPERLRLANSVRISRNEADDGKTITVSWTS